MQNGLGTKTDDLDLIIVTEHQGVDAQGPWSSMHLLANLIRRCGCFLEVVPIAHARVPIVKFKFISESGEHISADVNVNGSGFVLLSTVGRCSSLPSPTDISLFNTRLLRSYCVLDPRVRPFLMALKSWSKARQINNSQGGWLSSYAVVLMGLTYLVMQGVVPCLQRTEELPTTLCTTVVPGSSRTPRARKKGARPAPVVPPMEATEVDVSFRDYTEFFGNAPPRTGGSADRVLFVPVGMVPLLPPLDADIARVAFVSSNVEPLAALLYGFFETYSCFNRRTTSASLREGGFVPRPTDRYIQDLLVVEDPFPIGHNTTRNLSEQACGTLLGEFRRAADWMKAGKSFAQVCEPWMVVKQKQNQERGL